MYKTITVVLLIAFLAWAFHATRPLPPNICGSPGGPPITTTRIKLRDGRHLAYQEYGVSKEMAKYKSIFFHGFGSGRHEAPVLTPEVAEELGVYLVSFDRPGYGESDPDPKRTLKSTAFDVEELADKLGLGSKFYVIGFSMGGTVAWACMKYIPHRLAGATLIAPVVNYWLPGFPKKLFKEAYYEQLPRDQWAIGVAHYLPWLTYWWNTQKWFPASSVIARNLKLSPRDVKVLTPLLAQQDGPTGNVIQQGEFESLHRDLLIGFGNWEFDPMELDNPFPDNEGTVHLWQGDADWVVSIALQRYIAGRLPWIHYHEVEDCGHVFPFPEGIGEAILKTLVLGEK